MDTIFITDLRVETIIGIYDWERTTVQTVSVDLDMSANVAKAAASEDIADALNYKEISKRVETFIQQSSFQLIETMAESVATLVRDEFAVSWVRVAIHKPGALSNSTDVGVRIERGSAS